MDPYLIAYILLVLIYRLAESWAMARTGTLDRQPAAGLTVTGWRAGLIVIPYWLVILGAAFEYITFRQPPTAFGALLGTLFFAEATLVRVRAQLDRGEGVSTFPEKGQGIVTHGLYAHIRYPVYLAHVLLFIACPIFLSVTFAWGATLLGIAGIVARINMEERLFLEELPGYAQYQKQTARLIPRVW